MKINIKNNKKLIIIGSVVLVLVFGSVLIYKSINASKLKAEQAKKAVSASKEESFIMITGSGPIKSANRFEIPSEISGKIKKIYFKEGDSIKIDDLILEIDSTDAEANVNKLMSALEQSQLDLNTSSTEMGKLSIRAPFSGQVSNILVKPGDMIAKGSPILTIANRAKLKLVVPFNSSQIKNMTKGSKAAVYIKDTYDSVEGTISYISTSSYATEQNAKLYNVEILIDNPGTFKEGQKAIAEINTGSGTIQSPEYGSLYYVDSRVLKSEVDGKVENISLKEEQYVDKDSILMTVKNEGLSTARNSSSIKIKDTQTQLEHAQKQLEDYKIYSPMDGTISKLDLKEGQIVKPGDVISAVVDLGRLELVVPIDDVDISNVKLGQKVDIKVDALSWTLDKPIEGEVTKIPVEGNTVNGTTTYPVTISIANSPDLKVGMNANIEIKVDKKEVK